MTLKEAIESGRRFRRLGTSVWLTSNPYQILYEYVDSNYRPHEISKSDVLADDWELEPEPKKKVKMWQWVVFFRDSDRPETTSSFYKSKKDLMDTIDKTKILQRADWTEIEIEVPDETSKGS